MQRNHVEEIAKLVEVLDFVSAEECRIGAHTVGVGASRRMFIQAREGYPPIVAQMAQILYDRYYTGGDLDAFLRAVSEAPATRPAAAEASEKAPAAPSPLLAPIEARQYPDKLLPDDFAAHLDRRMRTTQPWEGGWRVVEAREDRLIVQRDGGAPGSVPRSAFRGDATPGSVGELRTTPGSTTKQPGWYHLRGDVDHRTGAGATVRIYWHLTRLAAGPFVEEVSRRFNAAGVPFHLKALSNPQSFTRADAGVLYFAGEDWPRARALVRDAYAVVGRYLRPETPGFTRRLARGLSVAEDPGVAGESFGMSRCRLLAEGVWRAWQRGPAPLAERHALVAAHLHAEGVDARFPYKGRDSPHDYALDVPEARLPALLEVA